MDLTGVKKLLLGISVLGNQVLLGEEGYGQGAAYSKGYLIMCQVLCTPGWDKL